ncbi:MAG: polyribonucleotide nucleotidyltransferase [bacterium]
MSYKEEITVGGRTLSIEVGKVANRADGAAWVTYGETIVLATACSNRDPMDSDFLPLMVDYREKRYAAGKIPGGFFKREARPADSETLISRLIDRPIRPLFPKDYRCDTQVFLNVYSADMDALPDVVAGIAASAALSVSDIPFDGPIAIVRVGMINDEFVLNPSNGQLAETKMELIVAGTDDAIAMVEGGAKEVSERVILDAIEFAHTAIKDIVALQCRIRDKVGKEKREHISVEFPEGLEDAVQKIVDPELSRIIHIAEKSERKTEKRALKVKLFDELAEAFPESEAFIADIYDTLFKKAVRKMMRKDKIRLDGRGYDDIRDITCELGILPRAHGSALFTRGQTQSLGALTLGTKEDEQRIDGLAGDFFRRFMFHYNFPPWSTGEVKRFMGTGRREIGHGNLAHRALEFIIPPWESFPYTIRIVSEILESNGSSSMASVCSGSLALHHAGVPVEKHVAGIAMGLISEEDDTVIITDILGDEDRLGDMDFKVAGTKDGITAIQMDIKTKGLKTEIMQEALQKAQNARFRILDIMTEAIAEPNKELSQYAPTIITIHIDVEDIGGVIGPGGKIVREIVEKTGAKIDIMDDGQINISSTDQESGQKAREWIIKLVEKPEPGKIYHGTVRRVADFGAFVEILPGKDGLLHISEIDKGRVDKVTDILNVGDEVDVMLCGVEANGKMDLSRRAVLIAEEARAAGKEPEPYVRNKPQRSSSGRNDRDSRGGGGRGGDRRPPRRD